MYPKAQFAFVYYNLMIGYGAVIDLGTDSCRFMGTQNDNTIF